MSKHTDTFKGIDVFFAAFIVVAFVLSFCLYNFQTEGVRRLFYFESLDNPGLFAEVRYVVPYTEEQSIDEQVEQFANDLLLGPVVNRFKNLFAPGTRIKTCFVRDGVLYVDITEQALQPNDVTSSIKRGKEIFEKNILKNFPDIRAVDFFIDGKYAYEDYLEA